MIKKLSLICLILTAMSSLNFAQKPEAQAFKFDEFVSLQENEWKQRLDKFAEMKISFPESSLMVYIYAQIGAERSSILELKKEYENYLKKVKKLESVFVRTGGLRKSQTTELWLVPKGAYLPAATPDEKFKPEKFAEIGVVDNETLIKKLKEFDEKMMEDSFSTGYIINYGNFPEVAERERNLADNLILRCFGGYRVVFVNGGDTGELKTQLWIVPPGADLPTP